MYIDIFYENDVRIYTNMTFMFITQIGSTYLSLKWSSCDLLIHKRSKFIKRKLSLESLIIKKKPINPSTVIAYNIAEQREVKNRQTEWIKPVAITMKKHLGLRQGLFQLFAP